MPYLENLFPLLRFDPREFLVKRPANHETDYLGKTGVREVHGLYELTVP